MHFFKLLCLPPFLCELFCVTTLGTQKPFSSQFDRLMQHFNSVPLCWNHLADAICISWHWHATIWNLPMLKRVSWEWHSVCFPKCYVKLISFWDCRIQYGTVQRPFNYLFFWQWWGVLESVIYDAYQIMYCVSWFISNLGHSFTPSVLL